MSPLLIGALLVPMVSPARDFERELSPDRPDTTESAQTLDDGAVQVEMSVWNYSRDFADGLERRSWSIGETNLKFGIAADQDLQFVFRPYQVDDFSGGAPRAEGFGDIDVRWKKNLWGNDGGSTAAALMPFVTIPTHTAVSTGEWEGGAILALGWDFAEGWDLGAQVEVDRIWDDGSSRHEWDFFHSIVLGRDLSEQLGIYLEYFGASGGHPYEANLSAGLTWTLGKNLQLDLGGVIGLNDEAEDYSIFQGVTIRF